MMEEKRDPLGNRVDFKLYACDQHLSQLRVIKDAEGTLVWKSRLQSEIEIDEFLYQLISTKDSMLQEINRELSLGIPEDQVSCEKINTKLNELGKSHVMDEINRISKPSDWLFEANILHNYSEHRNVIRKHVERTIGMPSADAEFLYNPLDDVPMQQDIITSLQSYLGKMENLIRRTREKVQRIRKPVADDS